MFADKKYTLRKLFNDIHLWMGVGSGLVLFIVCLTGTIYTFRHEVERLAEPEKYFVEVIPGIERFTADEVIQIVEGKTGGRVVSMKIPAALDETIAVGVKTSEEERRGATYYVNPYTGALIEGSSGKVSEFFSTVMRLHRWLLIEGETGKIIVGVSTIIFVFLIITGLIIWLPKKWKNWKQGLKIKFSGNWKRINHDLHNALGFYSAVLLLIMAFTGLCWSFGWYREGLSNVMGAKVFGGRGNPPITIEVPQEGKKVSINSILVSLDKLLPYHGNYRISIPGSENSAISISKNKTGFAASSGSDKIAVDPYTGSIVKLDKFSDKPLNEQIVASIKPLHTGEIFGLFSKILYFITCLIATSLPVTGVIIWINKLKKKSKKKKSTTLKNNGRKKKSYNYEEVIPECK